jgi:Ser/Thr protein kinase RdoA (MazF antagonist)
VHKIQSETGSRVDEHGNAIKLNWSQFLQEELREAVERRNTKQSDLSDEVMAVLEREVLALSEHSEGITKWSLLHADMHCNNVLVRGEDYIPFDKGSGIFFGDPLYDIATVAMEFHGAFTPTLQKDSSLWTTFIEAYGHDMHDPNLLRYILLRSIGRYPNTFTPRLKELIGCVSYLLINKNV